MSKRKKGFLCNNCARIRDCFGNSIFCVAIETLNGKLSDFFEAKATFWCISDRPANDYYPTQFQWKKYLGFLEKKQQKTKMITKPLTVLKKFIFSSQFAFVRHWTNIYVIVSPCKISPKCIQFVVNVPNQVAETHNIHARCRLRYVKKNIEMIKHLELLYLHF